MSFFCAKRVAITIFDTEQKSRFIWKLIMKKKKKKRLEESEGEWDGNSYLGASKWSKALGLKVRLFLVHSFLFRYECSMICLWCHWEPYDSFDLKLVFSDHSPYHQH